VGRAGLHKVVLGRQGGVAERPAVIQVSHSDKTDEPCKARISGLKVEYQYCSGKDVP
jgi:hypothetical protein